jgi:hypothetical protein
MEPSGSYTRIAIEHAHLFDEPYYTPAGKANITPIRCVWLVCREWGKSGKGSPGEQQARVRAHSAAVPDGDLERPWWSGVANRGSGGSICTPANKVGPYMNRSVSSRPAKCASNCNEA